MEKSKNMPALRFAEFSEAWEMKKLGEIGEIITGNTPSTTNKEYYNGDYLFVSPADIHENRWINETKTTLTKLGFSKGRIIKSGSNLFVCIGSTIGKIAQNKIDCISNQQINSVVSKYNDNNFIYSLLEYHSSKIKMLSATQAVPIINKTTFSNYLVKIPCLVEQQKIASFFTAIDEKLSQLKKKKNLLESYKKGMMQALFSQKLRFKDDEGNDFEDWKIKRLGDFAEIYDGTHQTPIYVEEGIPFYSVEQITANDFQKTKFISKEVFEKENKRVKIEKGDILMTRIGDVGTSKYIDWDVNASFYVSIVLIKQSTNYNSKYLNQFIGSNFFQNELWNRMIHVAFPKKINLGEIGNCLVKLPCLSEQKKIANFLSAIDERINCVSNEIKQMEIWKKGLLQHMFV